MHRLAILVLSLLLLAPGPAVAQSLLEHYTRALQARGSGEMQTYHDEMLAALGLEPGHPVLQIHLARACAQLGDVTGATSWFAKALAQGAWVDPLEDEWLASVREGADFRRLRDETLEIHAELARRATVGLECREYDLVPEGMAYDPVADVWYLSSVHKRKIVRLDRNGIASDFISPRRDGYLSGLGIAIDADRRRLWSASTRFEESADFDPSESNATFLHCWSLDDGRLLGRWGAPADSARHGFNDVCLLSDGSAIVTDASAGALYGARIGNEAFFELAAPGTLRGPNGLCRSDDGASIYVSEYVYGIRKLDLRTREWSTVSHPEGTTTIGTDGLYYHEGDLIAVQNYAGLDRAVRFRLDDTGDSILDLEILVARHPRMDDPTTGAIADGAFWFIANSHVEGFQRSVPTPSHEDWGNVIILRCDL